MGMVLSDQEVIDLQKWWKKEISKITQKLIDEEDRRQERTKKKNEQLLGEYQTETDVMEAYGYGMISEKKKDRLLDLIQEGQAAEPGRMYKAKIELLTEAYGNAVAIIAEKERLMNT